MSAFKDHLPKPPPPLEGVQNLTAEQLQAIAAKPHTDRQKSSLFF